jgi:thiol-disulfide isomerase/thioredoxin
MAVHDLVLPMEYRMKNRASQTDPIEGAGEFLGGPRRRTTPVGLSLVALLLLCVLYASCQRPAYQPPPAPSAHATIGRPLPELELKALTGSNRSIGREDLAGSVVLMNFWATWCGPCIDELPHIARLRESFAARDDFRLFAVSVGSASSALEFETLRKETLDFLHRENLEIPTYADPNGATLDGFDGLTRSLTPSTREGIPTTIVLDREGLIRGVWVGYARGIDVEMEKLVGELLDDGGG